MMLIAGLVTEVEYTLYKGEEKRGEARGHFIKPYFLSLFESSNHITIELYSCQQNFENYKDLSYYND